jgi:hypothetical protein
LAGISWVVSISGWLKKNPGNRQSLLSWRPEFFAGLDSFSQHAAAPRTVFLDRCRLPRGWNQLQVGLDDIGKISKGFARISQIKVV